MMHRLRATAVWLAAAALLGAIPVLAQNGKASTADKHFVKWAIETNNAEIGAAQLALKRTTSDDVREFAERMIHDHTMLNEQMKPVATKLGVSVAPGQVDQHQQKLADALKMLRGPAFDRKYIPAMVKGHTKALHKIQHEIATTHDMLVKDAAQRAEPVIQQHLDLAKKMAQDHNIHVGGKKAARKPSAPGQ